MPTVSQKQQDSYRFCVNAFLVVYCGEQVIQHSLCGRFNCVVGVVTSVFGAMHCHFGAGRRAERYAI